jgi:sugar phosphate permease
LNWLVAYLYEIGLKSYLSSLTIAWCVSSFLGSLMMGYFNRTVNRLGLVIPLLVCSIIFILLANQSKQIGVYVYFITITISGFCFGGPYGLVGSKVALSLANDPHIKSMKGAMGVIISLM